jgi:hypothetical protein
MKLKSSYVAKRNPMPSPFLIRRNSRVFLALSAEKKKEKNGKNN